MRRAVTLALLVLGASCKGPPAPLLAVEEAAAPGVLLDGTLAPLQAAFDAHVDVPRIVAILPSRCEVCSCGWLALRSNVLRAYPHQGLHVLLVLPESVDCDGCGAAAVADLGDGRVTLFRDRDGVAARAFARGHLPIAQASDVFFFYPLGARWHEGCEAEFLAPTTLTPRPEQWWHRLGRISPERHCTPEELGGVLRESMAQVLGLGPPKATIALQD